MANGFFLGGVQEGMAANAKRDLDERTLTSDTGLRSRGLDIQQGTLDRANQQDITKRADEEIANTMSVVTETIKAGVLAGRDPVKIQQTVAPLVDTAKAIASKVGRNPASLDAQVKATLFAPTSTETGAAKGTEKASATIAEEKALSAAGVDPSRFKEHKDKVAAENTLRDDYLKESKSFTTARDYRGNMQALPTDVNKWNGADDIVAVFAFMKMQDPNSAVMPGEQANANNAGGVPEAVRGLYNRLLGGGTLGEGARKDLRSTSENVFQQRVKLYNDTTKQFEGIAKRQGLNPKNIIIEYNSAAPAATAPPAGGGVGTIPPPPAGAVLVPVR